MQELHVFIIFMQSANPEFCGDSEVSEAYPSIEGHIPVLQRPVITLPGMDITAVVAREEHTHMVVYLGTSSGFLKKVICFLFILTSIFLLHKKKS